MTRSVGSHLRAFEGREKGVKVRMDGPSFSSIGKLLLVAGLAVAALGLVLFLVDKLPGASALGRLPGDIVWRGKNSTVYVPLATCLLISSFSGVLRSRNCSRSWNPSASSASMSVAVGALRPIATR